MPDCGIAGLLYVLEQCSLLSQLHFFPPGKKVLKNFVWYLSPGLPVSILYCIIVLFDLRYFLIFVLLLNVCY